jgi:hypothetical protein
MPIDIDFRKDYSLILMKELSSLGIEIDQTMPSEEIPYIYFNFEKRKIPQQARRIIKANDFTCPSDLSLGLDNLERKIINGDDLTPHLSKSVFRNYEGVDYLLNDWGIHHLHLGIEMEGKFVKRTGPVLFCIVTEEVIYFIATKQHGEWTDQTLLTTVYKNWPKLLQPFIMPNVISLETKLVNEDIKKRRKGNIMYPIELEHGVVIYPPGGGYATDGTSNEVVAKVFTAMRLLSDFEEEIKIKENNIRKQIIDKNKTPARTIKFQLVIKEDNLYAYEIFSKTMLSYDEVSFA